MTYVGNPFQSPNVLSFCPGLRGLERGLEAVIGKTNHVAFVEIESVIITNLVAEMEAGFLAPTPIWTNLKTFNPRPFRGRVHWILAGYPCTPFSLAGQRKGDRDPRHLWPYVRRAIETIRPICVFLENVDDHLTLGFEEVSRDLRKMGYNVEAGVYSAEEAGAPHERQRLFVLAVANPSAITWRISDTARWNESTETPRSRSKMANANLCRQQQWHYAGMGWLKESNALSYSSDQRLQGSGRSEPSRISGTTGFHHWPAGPGQQQHEWEPPRTLPREAECDVGLTVAGFSFREDFLRALGNACVPDQAAIAVKDLLRKHFE